MKHHVSNTDNPVDFPKNDLIEDLMYQSGLTASGCWDELGEYEKKAIEKFGQLLIKEFTDILENQVSVQTHRLKAAANERDEALYANKIRHFNSLCAYCYKHFGVKE